MPKFHGQSHTKILSLIVENEHFCTNLFVFNTEEKRGKINVSVFLELLKALYTPSRGLRVGLSTATEQALRWTA